MLADTRSPNSSRTRSQRGETLLESLIAIVLLTIVAIPALHAIPVALKASAQHREIAIAETLLRSSAEDLQNPDLPYIPFAGCEGHDTYHSAHIAPKFSPVAVKVTFWDPHGQGPGPSPMAMKSPASTTATELSTTTSCADQDPGLQMIQLSVRTPSGHLQVLSIIKREN
ncbi:MAG: prepilin-type N-terminal cleavage/methylation domain-containing protein [Microthrixaceae bacterium]